MYRALNIELARSASFSPDSKLLATSGDQPTLALWDSTQDLPEIKAPERDVETPLKISRRNFMGAPALSGSTDGKVALFGNEKQWGTYAQAHGFRPLPELPNAASVFSIGADGKRAVCGGFPGFLSLWDLESRRELKRVLISTQTSGASNKSESEFSSLQLLPDGRILGCIQKRLTFLCNSADGSARTLLDSGGNLAVSPDGKVAAFGQHKNSVIFDVESGQIVHTIPAEEMVNAVQFSRDGKRLYVGDAQQVRAVELETGQQLQVMRSKSRFLNSVDFLAVSPDDRLLAFANNNQVSVWNTDTWQEEYRIDTSTGTSTDSVHGIAFASDNRRLISGMSNNHILTWDTENFKDQSGTSTGKSQR